RVDRVALADVVEDRVVGEVDVARVVERDAAGADHVAERLGEWLLAPATGVVTRRDGLDLDACDLELVALRQLGNVREPEIVDDRPRPPRYDQVGIAIDDLEAPAVEVVDVTVCHEDRVDLAGATGASTPERIEQDARATQLRHRGGVTEPPHR